MLRHLAQQARILWSLCFRPILVNRLHPLAKIASGGELSRVMLAMKSVLAEADANA